MRFGYAVVALVLWVFFMAWIMTKGGIELSNDTQILSLAIIAAGRLNKNVMIIFLNVHIVKLYMRLALNKFIKVKEDSKGINNMIKTCCNRCGKEILYDARLQALLPTYKIEYINSFTYYKNNSFDLCTSCQIEFNNWMNKWLKEKNNEC